MADQTFPVTSGFYNAIDSDRTYSADDMCRPYRRLVSNGVFATPQGTPSTDLQVVSAGSGMGIIVRAGEGIFADKWMEAPATAVTVPNNTSTVARIDSVLVQVDLRSSGRAANIVYRTGTPSTSPIPPSINLVTNVQEYRVANIRVAPGASSIGQDVITDLRGSSECPWITSLVDQVDTSVLYDQWDAAYTYYYTKSTADFDAYMDQKETEFNQWFDNLSQELTAATNMVMYTSSYVTAGTTSSVPINILSYDHSTDILEVYINGLRAVEGTQFSFASGYQSIVLTNALGEGQTVTFVCFKSVISGDMATGMTLMQSFDSMLSEYLSDSGWLDITLGSGIAAYDAAHKPQIRYIGNKVYIRGAVTGIPAIGTAITTIPSQYRPSAPHTVSANLISSGNILAAVALEVGTDGTVQVIAASSTQSTGMLPLDTTYSIDSPGGWAGQSYPTWTPGSY